MDHSVNPAAMLASSGTPVEVEALRHSFGGFEALKSIDLSIRGGEFVALLGPSGCGKTTLLRCIAGLVQPTGGNILVGGTPITAVPVHRRGLGMVFQSYALFPHMTIAENVAFGLKMQGVAKVEVSARVNEALSLVRMTGYEGRYPAQLSGGQQQRVALARALVTHPKALLLDEPFGALDAKLRESMQTDLRKLQRRLGITTIFVTHDQQEALTMADRIAVMNGGRLEQFDTPRTIYDDPASLFVSDFIGMTNTFAGTVVMSNSEVVLAVEGSDGTVRLNGLVPRVPEGAVTCVVRPERVRLLTDSTIDGLSLPGRVSDVVFVGEKLNVHVDTPAGVFVVSMATDPLMSAPIGGQSIRIGFSTMDLKIFPR